MAPEKKNNVNEREKEIKKMETRNCNKKRWMGMRTKYIITFMFRVYMCAFVCVKMFLVSRFLFFFRSTTLERHNENKITKNSAVVIISTYVGWFIVNYFIHMVSNLLYPYRMANDLLFLIHFFRKILSCV
jgi:hypothetical protein